LRKTDIKIEGTVAPGFEPMREALRQNFLKGGEWGCAVCVWRDGEVVVDLWGGERSRRDQLPFLPTTLATAFSSTKGLAALCLLMLADRGKLDYDARVAHYWPGFAQGGKEHITVRTLLNHRAGLVGLDRDITLDQLAHAPESVREILEVQRPRWEPGRAQGYHAITFGLYAAELFRRVQGESMGTFLAREVAAPLGADVYLGLPEELEPRVAVNHPATTRERLMKILPKAALGWGLEGRVYRNVLRGGESAKAFAYPSELGLRGLHNFNTRRVHALELPWANALVTARGLCRVYAALANGGSLNGVELVRSETLEPLRRRQSWVERDRVMQKPLGWSQGFLKEETRLFSPNPESFGHPGAGGALGWCDPKAKIAIGYVTSKMAHHVRSPRALALCHALYRCLG